MSVTTTRKEKDMEEKVILSLDRYEGLVNENINLRLKERDYQYRLGQMQSVSQQMRNMKRTLLSLFVQEGSLKNWLNTAKSSRDLVYIYDTSINRFFEFITFEEAIEFAEELYARQEIQDSK